jgi:hypothetical protein
MNYISYQNTGEAAIDCAVIMLSGSSQAEGIVIKEFLDLGAGEGIAYTPSLSGMYGVGTKAEGSEDDYVLNEDYAPRYIYPSETNGHKPIIKGFSIAEFNDFYRVRFCITDDMNSDVYFQNYMFELLYAYVDGEEEDYQAGVTQFASGKSPLLIASRIRNSSLPSRDQIKYPYPVMIIRDTTDYESPHNIKAASDLLYFQHKMMYLGDTVMIPKIEGQSEPGRYLIFAVRRREISKPMSEISEVSGTYIMPIALDLTPVILEQSKTVSSTPAVATAKASCVLSGANDSTLTMTATNGGSKYNDLVVKMLGGESQSLDITIDETGYEMTIQLETNEAGESLSTLREVKEAADTVKTTSLEGGGSYNFGVIEISEGKEAEVIDLVETYSFTGGKDNGTVAAKDKILYDSGKVYIATRDMDGSEEDLSGWKAIDLYDAKSVDPKTTSIASMQTTLTDPGVYRKLQAAKQEEDALYEIEYNKFLVEPIINDPDAERATLTIPFTDGSLYLKAVAIGTAGNAYTAKVVVAGNDTKLSCSCSSAGAIVVNSATDSEGNATSTIYDVERALSGINNYKSLFSSMSAVSNGGSNIVEAMAETNFSGGVDGHRLLATSEELDNAVAAMLLPTLPTVIDLSDASTDYGIEGGKNSIIVLTNNAISAKDIFLPAAIVGLRVTIINQDDESVTIRPASGEYINGSGEIPVTLTTLTSATFYCYVDGYWAII